MPAMYTESTIEDIIETVQRRVFFLFWFYAFSEQFVVHRFRILCVGRVSFDSTTTIIDHHRSLIKFVYMCSRALGNPAWLMLYLGSTKRWAPANKSWDAQSFSYQVVAQLVSHIKPGEADIDEEFFSEQNKFFVLHDSKGFEPGNATTFDIFSFEMPPG